MSIKAQALLALCLAAFVAACGAKEEEVVYIEEPVLAEPVLNKY